MKSFRIKSKLFRYYSEKASWYFLPIDKEIADSIKVLSIRRGFGSVRVTVTIGETLFATSIFPDSRSKGFLLPVKKSVRDKENIDDGDIVEFVIDLSV
ncbi:MAG: hypothetical protein RI935_568 [Candidatus Parcubacteria bacterium]|jgi:hypothetical protein